MQYLIHCDTGAQVQPNPRLLDQWFWFKDERSSTRPLVCDWASAPYKPSPNERKCRLDLMARLDESEGEVLKVLEGIHTLGASDETVLEELERGDPSENTITRLI